MTVNPLRNLLKQLHHTLDGSPSIAPEDRALLKQLSADIQAVLAKSGAPAGTSHKTIVDQLQAAVTRFEVSHPDLTATMAQVSKQLGDMGI
jgi:ElaB/YqjD/DUF883 family membrane-anchored ribosome-binding protein